MVTNIQFYPRYVQNLGRRMSFKDPRFKGTVDDDEKVPKSSPNKEDQQERNHDDRSQEHFGQGAGEGHSRSRSSYFFRQGRQTKGKTSNPGILCLDWTHEMLFHKYNETENEATYLCKHRKHPSFACKAKLKVVKEESSERWIISTPRVY